LIIHFQAFAVGPSFLTIRAEVLSRSLNQSFIKWGYLKGIRDVSGKKIVFSAEFSGAKHP
jgi:hypothetical protein